jgi:hypothetical protein
LIAQERPAREWPAQDLSVRLASGDCAVVGASCSVPSGNRLSERIATIDGS